jgi:DNA recombination protein RmuC
MSVDTLLVLGGMVVGFGIVGVLLVKKTTASSNRGDQQMLVEWLKTMQSTLDRTNTTLAETLRGTTSETNKVLVENTKQLNARLDSAAHVIGELKRNMGELSEVGRGIKDLQNFLQSPKLRGGLGEEVLSDMISQLFPKQSFMLQYAFKSGAKVDAAIKTDGGILPIDAKFPMTHFMVMNTAELEIDRAKAKKEFIQDVKKHVVDISKKYILPNEGTLDFALMYIPSEAVYYEIVMTPELMTLAKKERIYPVSPNTLYAHLQVLLVSFQGREIEKKTHDVIQMLRGIVHDYEKLTDQYAVLGKHVTNAYNTHVSVSTQLTQLGHKIDQTKLLGEGTSE